MFSDKETIYKLIESMKLFVKATKVFSSFRENTP